MTAILWGLKWEQCVSGHIQETQKLHRINSKAHSESAEGQRQGQNLKAAREK